MLPKGKMGIAACRTRLQAIAALLPTGALAPERAAAEMLELIPHMERNRPSHTVAKRRVSDPMTPEKIEAVWRLHEAGLTGIRIAVALNISDGRVSEVLHELPGRERKGRRASADPPQRGPMGEHLS